MRFLVVAVALLVLADGWSAAGQSCPPGRVCPQVVAPPQQLLNIPQPGWVFVSNLGRKEWGTVVNGYFQASPPPSLATPALSEPPPESPEAKANRSAEDAFLESLPHAVPRGEHPDGAWNLGVNIEKVRDLHPGQNAPANTIVTNDPNSRPAGAEGIALPVATIDDPPWILVGAGLVGSLFIMMALIFKGG